MNQSSTDHTSTNQSSTNQSTSQPRPDSMFQLHRYRTDDADQGHQFIHQAYVDVDVEVHGRPDNFHLASDTVQVGEVLINHLQHSMAVGMHARDGVAWQAIFQSRQPTIAIDVGQREHRLGTGDALTLRPDVPYSCTWDSLDADIINLDLTRAADQAAAHATRPQPFHFEFGPAVSSVAAEHWRQTVNLVRRVGLANAQRPDGALLADQLSELLTTAALTCFPNTTTRADPSTPTRTNPASLRRAITYIDSHLDQPLRLNDIATAARVSPRALNLTFNRHLGTTPMAYVRRARLDRAHHDLKTASSEDGATVTEIAARWGFYSLPRFGVTYRQTYGHPPSHTLRHG